MLMVIIMLGVSYAKFHFAECHYAECHYVQCLYAKFYCAEYHNSGSVMLSAIVQSDLKH